MTWRLLSGLLPDGCFWKSPGIADPDPPAPRGEFSHSFSWHVRICAQATVWADRADDKKV